MIDNPGRGGGFGVKREPAQSSQVQLTSTLAARLRIDDTGKVYLLAFSCGADADRVTIYNAAVTPWSSDKESSSSALIIVLPFHLNHNKTHTKATNHPP